jgi:shikimate dehydrogenase
MRTFGIIGFPLAQSLSPQYFTQKFMQEGMHDCEYLKFEITDIAQLPGIVEQYPTLAGFNVTIPYKKKIIRFLHQASPEVVQMVACNCVKMVDGQLYGYNTDYKGFLESIRPHLRYHHAKALVLGTGGAAAAAQFALNQQGIKVQTVSRNPQVGDGAIAYGNLTPEVMRTHLLVVNCSPVGSFPKISESPNIPYQLLTERHLCYDMVYNPEQTFFLQKAAAAGATIQNGKNMFTLQAEENWKIWNP